MGQIIPTVGYAVVVTGTILSMSLQYQGFLETEMIPDKIYLSRSDEQYIIDEWNGSVIGESIVENDTIEQINLPTFENKYKVKIRVRNAGRLQPPRFTNAENV